MAPRPNSHNEPSSRRAISKSSKRAAASGAPGCPVSSRPARSRQAKQTRFAPSASPQTEQTMADAGPIAVEALTRYQNLQELAQLFVDFRFGFHGPSHLGPKYRSEERRVGKECRSRRSPYHLKKNED